MESNHHGVTPTRSLAECEGDGGAGLLDSGVSAGATDRGPLPDTGHGVPNDPTHDQRTRESPSQSRDPDPGVDGRGQVRLSPYPVRAAEDWVRAVHRKLPHLDHRMWAIAAWDGDRVVGVAVVGPPTARRLAPVRDGSALPPRYHTLEIVRVAVIEGTRNVCSRLYGACSRAARAMGVDNLLTYTEAHESGASLRAANFVRDHHRVRAEQADRPGRPRQQRLDVTERVRWWAPWSLALARTAARRT